MTVKTVTEISDALRNALTAIPGLRVFDYLPDQINPPVGYVGIESVNYHGAFSGGNPVHNYTVTIVVGRTSDRASQRALDEFLAYDSPRSVRDAIETDPTLGGFVSTLIVTQGGNLQTINIAEVIYVAIDFSVTIYP
jgi:hypothetical protein